jgi:hypothetical protein
MRNQSNFRGQSGRRTTSKPNPSGGGRPNRGKNPNPAPRTDGAGAPVGCICGNHFSCIGFTEVDFMGQYWDNCSCCFRNTGK